MFLVLNAIAVTFNIALFLVVFVKNHRSTGNKYFLTFLASITAWIVVSSLEVALDFSNYTLWLVRLDFALGVVIGTTFFLFSLYFPKKPKKSKSSVPVVLTFASLLIALSFSDKVVARVEGITSGVKVYEGQLFIIYGIFLLLISLYSCLHLFRKLKQSTGLEKSQVRMVFSGLLALVVIVLLTNLILPRFIDPTVSDYGIFGFLVFIYATAYAIVRYRLMDIRLVVTRSLIYAVLVSFVTGAFVVTTYVGSLYITQESVYGEISVLVFAALAIVILLDPLKNILARATNKIFFKAAIDYAAVTKILANIINEEIELDHLIKRFSATLESELRLRHATILLPMGSGIYKEPEELVHISHTAGAEGQGGVRTLREGTLTKELKKSAEVLVLDEVDRQVTDANSDRERARLISLRDELEASGSQAIVPISHGKGLEAVVMLSRKLSGEAFSNDDIQLFGVIAPQMASGIQKALLFQEQKEFAGKLQREVDRATAELRSANSKLMDLDQAKSEFMSIASHQLRTPLAGIMGYLSMITDGDYGKMNPEQEPVLKDVLDATQRLIRMVNVFLNVTRIEAGRFVMNFAKVPFHDVIEAVYKELKPTADKKKVKLIYKKKKLPDVEVDSDKIRDVILNLIDNAIKYTPKGSVTVWGEADKKSVTVHVKDSGVGIPKGEAENLFNKFVRGSGIARVDPSGSGLGLFIAKKITEGHGGKIWAESTGPGEGSTFSFTIPIKADPKAKQKTEEFKARAVSNAPRTAPETGK